METNRYGVPDMFRSLLWSYRFDDIDAEIHQGLIIRAGVSYGTLEHIRWLCNRYGKSTVMNVVKQEKESNMNATTVKLMNILLA